MSFPLSVKILIDTDRNSFVSKLKKSHKVKNLFSSENKIGFRYESGVMGMNFDAVCVWNDKKSCFEAEFFIEKIFIVLVVLVVIIGFVVKGLISWIVAAIVLFVVVYLLLTVFFSLEMNYLIEENYRGEKLTKQQLKWIEDNSRCPACGSKITEFDKECPECNLNLENWRDVKKQNNVSRTGFWGSRIVYKFKKD